MWLQVGSLLLVVLSSPMVELINAQNPCTNYINLTITGDRNPDCPYDIDDDKCDLFITANWFRVQDEAGSFPVMSTTCLSESSCGASYPVWMNGAHPNEEDDIVNATVCMSTSASCCELNHTISIINCSLYYVYYLVPIGSCPARYCFETEMPCPTTTTSVVSVTTLTPLSNTTAENKGIGSHVHVTSYVPAIGITILLLLMK